MNDQLLLMLVHDLRNPLSVLVSTAEFLGEEEMLNSEAAEALEDMAVGTEVLTRAAERLALAGGFVDQKLRKAVELRDQLAQVCSEAGARIELTGPIEGLQGVIPIVEALLETTRLATVLVDESRLRICDDAGPLPSALRARAFDSDAQGELKAAGRYARFLGVRAAKRRTDALGLAMEADDRPYALTLRP